MKITRRIEIVSMDIKALREQKHLTQDELARESGLSIRTIQRIEAGQEPKGYTAKALSKVLGVDVTAKSNTEHQQASINCSKAKIINLSTLFVASVPLLNVLLPLSIMYFAKQFNSLTKQILSLQVLWAIVAILAFIILGFLRMTFSYSLRINQWVMIALVIINVLIILLNTAGIDRKRRLYIKLNFSFI